jgi:acetylornithine deacetylase
MGRHHADSFTGPEMSAAGGGSSLDAFVAARLPVWTAWLQNLVRIPSRFEEEHAAVAFVEARLRELGCARTLAIEHDPGRLRTLAGVLGPISEVPGRKSLVAVLPGAAGGRSLTLSAHLDIAHEGPHDTWSRLPFGGEIDGAGRLCGRGAMDDKAGVAALLAVADAVSHAPVELAGDLVLHFVLEDEITGNGTLLCLADGPRTDAALIVDGTRFDRAIRAHAGQLQGHVEVTGRPASVAVSHLGRNAADLLGTLLTALRDDIASLNAGRAGPWDRFPSPFQFVTQALSADAPVFTVPERARARFFATFCPPWSLTRFRARIEATATDLAEREAWPAPPRFSWDGYATEPVESTGAAFERALQEAVAAVGLAPVDVGPSTGTSDMRHFVNAGIACLLYGPGRGANPHRPDEYYHVADLGTMVRVCLDLAARWGQGR